jgi:hypothetical protein
MTPLVVATNEGLFRITEETTVNEIIDTLGAEEAKIIMSMILDGIMNA